MVDLWTPSDYRRRVTNLPSATSTDDVIAPNGMRLRWREVWHPHPHSTGAMYGGPRGLAVIASLDLTPTFGTLLHVSLSYRDHDPEWAVIKAVRGAFYPEDVDVMMVLPRESDYVNVHQFTYHLWQTPSAWGMR